MPTRISRALRVYEGTVRRLARGDARTISPPPRDAIADLYDAWWDKTRPARTAPNALPPPASAAVPSPRTGAPAPLLDDDQLEVPGYRRCTGYRPATGTPPPAPGIRLPVRRHGRKGA